MPQKEVLEKLYFWTWQRQVSVSFLLQGNSRFDSVKEGLSIEEDRGFSCHLGSKE